MRQNRGEKRGEGEQRDRGGKCDLGGVGVAGPRGAAGRRGGGGTEGEEQRRHASRRCLRPRWSNEGGGGEVAEWNGARAVVRSKGASFFNADGAVLPAALSRLRLALSAELPMPSILRHLSFCCSSTHFIFSFFCRVFRWLEVRATEFMVTLRRFAMVSRKICVSHGHLTCTPVSHGHTRVELNKDKIGRAARDALSITPWKWLIMS